MKAPTCSGPDYYRPDHRTRKAYRQLIDARNLYYFGGLTLPEFIERVDKIIYNQIPQSDLYYFGKTPYITILKELASSEVSEAAAYRLKTDLLTVY